MCKTIQDLNEGDLAPWQRRDNHVMIVTSMSWKQMNMVPVAAILGFVMLVS